MRWLPMIISLVSALARAAPCEKPDARASRTTATDAAVTACFGEDPPLSCWRFDVAARTWAKAPDDAIGESSPVPSEPAPEAQLAALIRVCARDGTDCETYKVPGTGARTQTQVIHNADRSLVGIYGRPGPLELFDGKTARRLALIKGPKSPMLDGFETAMFVGDSVVGFTQDSPITTVARLYAGRTGRLLATIGGGTAIDSDPRQLTGARWLFTGFYGDALYIHDVVTGRLVRTIKLVGGHADPGTPPALVYVRSDGKQVTALRGDPASGVVVYDATADRQALYPVPTCK